jgi:nucleoside-diphosphate-sugar epimerase
MSRILVTGGCGFIGHRVVEQLQQLGHQVRVIDNMTRYGIIPWEEHNYLVQERKRVFNTETIMHQVDIESSIVETVFEMFMPEIVIHLASIPRQRVVNNNPRDGARVLCEGLLNLLEASVKHGVKKFVYVSSSMVYGDFTDNVKEDAHCNPQGSYAIMKYMGEQLVKDYSRRGLLQHVIIRPSAVYGSLDIEDRVVSKFLLGAMRGETLQVNGPEERLDFTQVEDTASGIVGAILSDNTRNKTYNITRSESITLLQAAELAVKISGSGSIQINERDLEFPSRGSLNIDAARQDFDYKPTIDFNDGLSRYHEWVKSSSYWRQQLRM